MNLGDYLHDTWSSKYIKKILRDTLHWTTIQCWVKDHFSALSIFPNWVVTCSWHMMDFCPLSTNTYSTMQHQAWRHPFGHLKTWPHYRLSAAYWCVLEPGMAAVVCHALLVVLARRTHCREHGHSVSTVRWSITSLYWKTMSIRCRTSQWTLAVQATG